jgi:excisionase family DNA binding protein
VAQVRMSVSQVAERWGCSRQHIYNMIKRGELPAFRVRSLYRLKAEDVITHEERQIRAQFRHLRSLRRDQHNRWRSVSSSRASQRSASWRAAMDDKPSA